MSWRRICLTLLLGCRVAFAQSAPSLAVDNNANRNPISPDIYGIDDYGDTGLANIMPVGARRWGGDATSRYNWQLDTYNSAGDYYFENYAYAPPPAGSAFNTFIETGLSTGTLRLGTIPVMGWMPNTRNNVCSFSVAKYGAQQMVDPYHTDCGNGVLTDGTDVKNDPTDANYQVPATFQQQWIQAVMAKYGSAQRGGVQVWSLDNEPEWWYAVHRDIHPATSTYDEMLSDHQVYAALIKQTDPTALVTGPVAAGWCGYFYSATDFVAGWSTSPYRCYDNPVDQNAHGGVAWMDYYLQQMQAYEQQNGVRLVDYVDLHAYISPTDISFQNNAGQTISFQNPQGQTVMVDADTLRLTSTRVFWDPNYVSPDGSTENTGYPDGEPPQLVPRMLRWVANDYPGTKTAITEYNWGATNDITGAIAQADILGIFGREGLDLGAMWGPPNAFPTGGAPVDPAVFAFSMYLNYDGLGSRFGQTSISATTGDPDQLSIFAAQRDDNAVTIMVLNKTTTDLNAPIPVANFQAAGNAQVWQYSAANLAGIQQMPDLQLASGTVNATFPARSITLLVLPAEPSSLPVPQPVIGAVASAASYNASAVSPGELVAIFGTNLGPSTLAGGTLTPDGGYLAQSAGSVSVSFNGYPAAMVYASSGQLAALVPYEVALAQTAAVTVEVQGVRSAAFTIPVATAMPALFTSNASGAGQGAILNADLSLNSAANPAAQGQVVVLFGTGEGQTNPPGVDGRIQSDVPSVPAGACAVTIGGQKAVVQYCAFAPYEVSGIVQINAVVPTGISSGNVPVSFSIGSVSSPTGVTLAVK